MVSGKTEVVIIGTIHNQHDQNPRYSTDMLRRILLDLEPAAICVELDSYYFNSDGTLQIWVVERPELRAAAPETVVADNVCSTLGIEMLPFDIEGKQEFFQQTDFWQRAKHSSDMIDKWYLQLSKDDPTSEDLEHWKTLKDLEAALDAIISTQGPEVINSDVFDRLTRVKGSNVWDTILSRYTDLWKEIGDYEQLSYDWWQRQNAAMADNLLEIADRFRGRRVTVVVGASHRYMIRDNLRTNDSVIFNEFWTV